jgi:hypothetical protein
MPVKPKRLLKIPDQQQRDDRRADHPEDRPGQQRVRLSGPGAEIGRRQGVAEVAQRAEPAGRDALAKRVAGVVVLEAEEQVGEAGGERHPQGDEVVQGAALADGDHAGAAGRIVVQQLLGELFTRELALRRGWSCAHAKRPFAMGLLWR